MITYPKLFLFILSICLTNPSYGDASKSCLLGQKYFRECQELAQKRGKNLETYCAKRIAQARKACGHNSNFFKAPVTTTRDAISGAFNKLFGGAARALGRDVSACTRMPSCAGQSHIEVDISSRCMCVGETCFKVGVSYGGGVSNPVGSGQVQAINRPDGVGKYQTNRITRSDRYDDDALAMSLPGVWNTGKWIHKSKNCTSNWRTKGCIAVPCRMWDLVKASVGESITVCRGGQGAIPNPANKSQRIEN